MAFSPEGQRLASASWDKTVKVWDARTGQEGLTLNGHTDCVWGVAISPDGQRLASASQDGTVKVWDARTGQETFTFKGHTSSVHAVAFSPDGQRLASASLQTVKVWDARTGEETLTLMGHVGDVWGVAFSPDGQRLASCGDGTVKLWEARIGQETLKLLAHTSAVAFSADGQRLASCSGDGTVKLWETAVVKKNQQGRKKFGGNNTVPIWDGTLPQAKEPKFPQTTPKVPSNQLVAGAIEGETMHILGKSDAFDAGPQDMSLFSGSQWSGNSQLFVRPPQGGWVDLELPVPNDGRYHVIVYLTKAQDYGVIQFYLDGKPIGKSIDCFEADQVIRIGPIDLGEMDLKKGNAAMRVEVVGTNPKSVGWRYMWGLDCVVIKNDM